MKKNVLLLLLMISISTNILSSSSSQNIPNTDDSVKKLLARIVENETYDKFNKLIQEKEAVLEKIKKHSIDLFNRGVANYDIVAPAFVLGLLSVSTRLRVLAGGALFFGGAVACVSTAAAFGGCYALKAALENEKTEKTTEKKA